jgi:hypothetical protein
MSFRTSHKNYRDLLRQIDRIGSVIGEVSRLIAWKPESGIPAMDNLQRDDLRKARAILRQAKREYEDLEGLCRPIEHFDDAHDAYRIAGETIRKAEERMQRNIEREIATLKRELSLL